MTSTDSENKAYKSYLEEDGGRKGIFKWILSTDHKRIALLYLYSMMVWFTVGVVLGLLMKLELIAPGQTIMGPQSYNATFTVHGVIMIVLAAALLFACNSQTKNTETIVESANPGWNRGGRIIA